MRKTLLSPFRRPANLLRRHWGRRRFAQALRSTDLFVATFPKSGTTWLGYFLALVLSERAGVDGNELDLMSFREWVPDINTHYFGSDTLREYQSLPDPRAFTLHAPHDRLLPRVLYVVRDPRAVAVSYYYHTMRTRDDFHLSLSDYVRDFVADRAIWPCGWSTHVQGWLEREGDEDFRLIRYEELKKNPLEAFRIVLDFLGLSLPPNELESYIERSSFEKMKALEKPRPANATAPHLKFIRRGSAGGWREELDSADVRRIESRYGELMERLGYLTAS